MRPEGSEGGGKRTLVRQTRKFFNSEARGNTRARDAVMPAARGRLQPQFGLIATRCKSIRCASRRILETNTYAREYDVKVQSTESV